MAKWRVAAIGTRTGACPSAEGAARSSRTSGRATLTDELRRNPMANRPSERVENVVQRIHRLAVGVHLVVEVRPGGAARGAHERHEVAAPHALALGDARRLQMSEKGCHA